MLKKILIISALLITPAFADQAADKAEFKKLYAEFNDLYASSEEIEPSIVLGKKLYNLAPKAYGKNHKNTAVVTYNLAKLYDDMGNYWIEYTTGKKIYKLRASEYYKEYFNILLKLKEPINESYISQYFSFVIADILGKSSYYTKRYASRLINMAEDFGIPENEIAELEFNIAIAIYSVTDPRDAQKYLKKSYNRNLKTFGENHFKIGQNQFWRAKIDFIKKRYSSAEKRYKKALLIFEDNPNLSEQLIPQTHALLIALYEETNKSELSTKHIQFLAVERSDNFNRKLEPIFKIMPKFVRKPGQYIPSGEIELIFNIDKDGKTKDIKIVKSDHKEFVKPLIESISKWRYAPTIRNGKLVETTDITYSMVFSQ
jgi:hypothetical protein